MSSPQDAEAPTLIPAAKLVYDYLLARSSISNMVAMNSLGVGSLSRRITDIKRWLEEIKSSYEIKSEFKKDHSGARYKSYSLVPKSA